MSAHQRACARKSSWNDAFCFALWLIGNWPSFEPSKSRGRSAFDSLGPDTQANQEFCDFGRLAPAQRGTCGGEQQNAAAQYSSANMMVITRSVTDGSAGSGE